MSHVREQLVGAVVTAVTGLTTTGSNVFTDRPDVYSLTATEIPALLVYDLGDSVVEEGEYPTPIQRRAVNVAVEAIAKSTSGLSTTMRTICSEVETALGAALSVGGTSVYLFYRGVDIAVDATSDRPVMSARMRFEATVYTYAGSPDSFA